MYNEISLTEYLETHTYDELDAALKAGTVELGVPITDPSRLLANGCWERRTHAL